MKELKSAYRRLHPQINSAMILITLCILEYIIIKDGKVTVKSLEDHTQLKSVSLYLLADILKILTENNIISIQNDIIYADIDKLNEIVEQEKIKLPAKHNMLWEDKELINLASMKIKEMSVKEIAKKLNRTEKSITYQTTLLRKAYRMIPLIEKNNVIKEFAEMQFNKE